MALSVVLGGISALGSAVYMLTLWGRNDAEERTAQLFESYGGYKPNLWSELVRPARKSSPGPEPTSTLFPTPLPLEASKGQWWDAQVQRPEDIFWLSDFGFADPLLPHFRLVVPQGKSIDEIRQRALAAPTPQLEVVSTQSVDFKEDTIRGAVSRDLLLSNPMLRSVAYLTIYDIPVVYFPEQLQDQYFAGVSVIGIYERDGSAKSIPLWTIQFQAGNRQETAHFHMNGNIERALKARSGFWEVAPYSFVRHFSAAIDQAARRLADSHPDLHYANLRVLMRKRIFEEQKFMGPEDLAQDRAACHFAGCPWRAKYAAASRFVETGIPDPWFGRIRPLPNFIWQFLSWTPKYHLDKQGIGPLQIVVGLAKKAGQSPDLIQRYEPQLTPQDFQDPEAVVRALLDPHKAIFLRAMIFDHILRELKRTLFADAQMQYPANRPPFITDSRTAREYGLLFSAAILSELPEIDRFLPGVLTGNPQAFFDFHSRLFMVSEMFEAPLELPGLFMPRMEYHDRQNNIVAFAEYEVQRIP